MDENDLCFLGGWPGPLREMLGIWAEEIDALYENDANAVLAGCRQWARAEWRICRPRVLRPDPRRDGDRAGDLWRDFYAGRPALTVNELGKGRAYYIASRNDERFLDDFYAALGGQLSLLRALDAELPSGVSAQLRTDGERRFVFLMNFNPTPVTVELGRASGADLLTGKAVSGQIELAGYGVVVLAG